MSGLWDLGGLVEFRGKGLVWEFGESRVSRRRVRRRAWQSP